MAEALDRTSRIKRCGYCNDPGHIHNNKVCWRNRKLEEKDGEVHAQEDILGAMKSHLFNIPIEVQEAKRMLHNGDQPKTAECIDYILYHQIKANDQMKATMQLVGRIVGRMKDLDHKFAVPPDAIRAVLDRENWDRAITERGNEIGEVRRMTRDLEVYLDVVGDALDRGFTGDSEVFAAIERHKVASATGTAKDGFVPWIPVSPSLTVTEHVSACADLPSGTRRPEDRGDASPLFSEGHRERYLLPRQRTGHPRGNQSRRTTNALNNAGRMRHRTRRVRVMTMSTRL